MRIVLSVDIGTSKVAAVAFDCLAGKSIAAASRPNATDVMGLPPGLHEQDPRAVYELCLELLGGLLGYGKFAPAEVAAIAFSGQMHGVLLASRDLEPLTKLMTWRDRRASGLVSSIDRATWPVGRTGCYLHPGYGGATLAALAMEGLIPTGTVALDMADFVAAKLTGIAAADPTMAASWGIMDLRRGEWDEELLSRLRIPREALPPIVTGSRPLGRLVVDLGLPLGVPVYPPVGDNQASYIGAAGLEGRLLLLNLGTGGQISIPSAVFEFRHEFETRPLPTGGYLMVGASLCGGGAYAILKEFFRATLREFAGMEFADADLYRVMNRLSASGAKALPVDTRFAGTRADPRIRGGIGDIGIDDLNPASLTRGVALGMVRELTKLVTPEMRGKFDRVLASGNAVSENPLLRRFISEELAMPCEPAANGEEAATGAALLAARAMRPA